MSRTAEKLALKIKSRTRVFRDLPNRDIITSKEAGGYVGVCDSIISLRAKRGEIPGAFKLGKRWRFDRETFVTWARPILAEHSKRVEDFHTEKIVVYIVQCGEFAKIGWTSKLGLRLHSMRLHNPMPITVLATLDGGKALEYQLHQRFKELAIGREWFRYEGALKEYVEGLSK